MNTPAGTNSRPAMRQSTLTMADLKPAKYTPYRPYVVGELYDINDDERQFKTLQEAADCALELSEGDAVYAFGVWDSDGECLLIAHGGELYRK